MRTSLTQFVRSKSGLALAMYLAFAAVVSAGVVMGALAIDIPVASFLQGLRTQSYQLGLGLFAALAAVGLAIAVLHFRQTSEREVAACELRTQNMLLDTALKNMSQGLCMFDADERLVIANSRYAEM